MDPESGYWTLWEDNIDARGNSAMEEKNYSAVHQVWRHTLRPFDNHHYVIDVRQMLYDN